MLIIGCDYHPGFQQIAFVDTETGELGERRLTHREEANQFYRALKEWRFRISIFGRQLYDASPYLTLTRICWEAQR
jgi:hypothetical protein